MSPTDHEQQPHTSSQMKHHDSTVDGQRSRTASWPSSPSLPWRRLARCSISAYACVFAPAACMTRSSMCDGSETLHVATNELSYVKPKCKVLLQVLKEFSPACALCGADFAVAVGVKASPQKQLEIVNLAAQGIQVRLNLGRPRHRYIPPRLR